jgi:hypothetical protein
VAIPCDLNKEVDMVTTIGIDPHKATHTAVAINETETVLGELTVPADRSQTRTLLDWAQNLDGDGRVWAVEAAGGLGYLLSQQLVAHGEHVVDVPPVLASRVRLLGSGKSDKNDPNDARSVAIAALRQPKLAVVLREDHTQVLRMLAKRHLELTSLRTQAVCRLHSVLTQLRPGGMGQRLSAKQASRMLRGMRTLDVVEEQRRSMARTHLGDIRRLDREKSAGPVVQTTRPSGQRRRTPNRCGHQIRRVRPTRTLVCSLHARRESSSRRFRPRLLHRRIHHHRRRP